MSILLASGGTSLALSSGILSAQLLSQPAVMADLMPASALPQHLQDDRFVVREMGRTHALGDQAFHDTVRRLSELATTPAVESESTVGSQQRAEGFIRTIRQGLTQAQQHPELGDWGTRLQAVVDQHPELFRGDLQQWRDAGDDAAAFVADMQGLVRTVYQSYRGWRQLSQLEGLPQLEALRYLLEAAFASSGERLLKQVSEVVLTELLTEQAPELLTAYHEQTHFELFSEQVTLQQQFAETLPGSPERIEAFWRLASVSLEMARRVDFEGDGFRRLQLLVGAENMTPADRQRLEGLQQVLERFPDPANPQAQRAYLNTMAYFSRQARESSQAGHWPQHLAYRAKVQDLFINALQRGMNPQHIQRVIGSQGMLASSEPITMQEIYEGTREVTVAALPPEIRKFLTELGHTDNLDRVDRIIFTPIIDELLTDRQKGWLGTSIDGLAFFPDNTVIVGTHEFDPTGKKVPSPAWSIAAKLVHEPAHVALYQQVLNDPAANLSWGTVTVQERYAYAQEYQYYQNIIERYGQNMDLQSFLLLELRALSREAIIHGCNFLLGLPLSDVSADTLPAADDQPLERFGGVTGRQMDRMGYPARLPGIFRRLQLRGLDQLQFKALQHRMEDRIAGIQREFERRAQHPVSGQAPYTPQQIQQWREAVKQVSQEYYEQFAIRTETATGVPTPQ